VLYDVEDAEILEQTLALVLVSAPIVVVLVAVLHKGAHLLEQVNAALHHVVAIHLLPGKTCLQPCGMTEEKLSFIDIAPLLLGPSPSNHLLVVWRVGRELAGQAARHVQRQDVAQLVQHGQRAAHIVKVVQIGIRDNGDVKHVLHAVQERRRKKEKRERRR
jgi:hypothetical protein